MIIVLFLLTLVGYMLLMCFLAAVAVVAGVSILVYLTAFGVRLAYGKLRGETDPPTWAVNLAPFHSFTRERAAVIAQRLGMATGILTVIGFITYCFVVTS